MMYNKSVISTIFACFAAAGLLCMHVSPTEAQTAATQNATPQFGVDRASGYNYRPIDDQLLEWPLAPADKAYASIDGHKLKQYASEIVAIRERYRDQGHQFWGTITGTSSDVETQQWVLGKFKQFGLEVRTVEHDLPPQFQPTSWDVTVTGNGKTLPVTSAFPVNNIPGTPPAGLDLEAVYVGTGSEAEFSGRDV